ncbi:hypothetical protein ZTR_10976 [Talaromyces verruculosus]|nr:hypothetical protein ZTR_10976 [Talaromyces verruculosus]
MPIQTWPTTPSVPRPSKKLTDEDRRRICLYYEANKSAKQADIGALFGVERSTVSNVLRQKEKYLSIDNGSRSTTTRCKGNVPKIKKALAGWIRNSQRQRVDVTRTEIEEKANLFAENCATPDEKQKIFTPGWVDEFLRNENLTVRSSLENSADIVVSDGEGTPPIPPTGPTPCLLPSLGQGMKDGVSAFNSSGYFAQQDHSSALHPILASSAGMTSLASTLFSESLYVPTAHSRHPSISSATSGLRDQMFAEDAGIVDKNGEIYSTTDSKHSTNGPFCGTLLDSPLDEKLEEQKPTDTCDINSKGSVSHHESNADLKSTGHTMQPRRLPTVTQDEARDALDLVINYVKSEPGLELRKQDHRTLGELREKLERGAQRSVNPRKRRR